MAARRCELWTRRFVRGLSTAQPRLELSRYVRRSRLPPVNADVAAEAARRSLEASGLASEQAALVQGLVALQIRNAAEAARDAARLRARERANSLLARVDDAADCNKSVVRVEVARLKSDLAMLVTRLGYDRERAFAANQRDLELEAAELDDSRAAQSDSLNAIHDELDEELAKLRTELAKSKHDMMTYAVAHLVSILSFGCVVVRFLS